jgi:hypothetical protein
MPQLYCTLSTQVCKTKTYFPPEPKTDTTAQLEKSSFSPRAVSVIYESWERQDSLTCSLRSVKVSQITLAERGLEELFSPVLERFLDPIHDLCVLQELGWKYM